MQYSQRHVSGKADEALKERLGIGLELAHCGAAREDGLLGLGCVVLLVRGQPQQHLHHPLDHVCVECSHLATKKPVTAAQVNHSGMCHFYAEGIF